MGRNWVGIVTPVFSIPQCAGVAGVPGLAGTPGDPGIRVVNFTFVKVFIPNPLKNLTIHT
jgi:hypothetical protein